MKNLIYAAAIAVFLSLAASPALAGPIHHRQMNQRARIHQGVRCGQLTRWETRSLAHQQKRIQHAKRQAWADGRMNQRERTRIRNLQNQAGERIHRMKHNPARR